LDGTCAGGTFDFEGTDGVDVGAPPPARRVREPKVFSTSE
jgi:hypothetical protein